jgi:hypothetical protein
MRWGTRFWIARPGQLETVSNATGRQETVFTTFRGSLCYSLGRSSGEACQSQGDRPDCSMHPCRSRTSLEVRISCSGRHYLNLATILTGSCLTRALSKRFRQSTQNARLCTEGAAFVYGVLTILQGLSRPLAYLLSDLPAGYRSQSGSRR